MNALAPGNDDWIIKGYEYLATLGEGSFAAAYRVRHRKLRVDRVIKLLKSELVQSDDGEDYPALFAEEARVLALIRNENVPQVFDCGETDDGRPFFVMEFLNGKDLSAVIEDEKRTPFPVRTVLNLGICILDGLAAAHQVGIIHRDIKPANIFIVRPDQPGGSPKAKVIDFGTFSPIGKTEKRDGKVVCRGTARYAPPEQFTGQALTTAADVYSVGVVLHEMLTGLFPFSWLQNSDSLAEAHATRPLRPIDTVRSDVPGALTLLIDWLLQKDLTKRPSSAELCARKLRDLKDELDLVATVSRAATGRSILVEDGAGHGEVPSVDPARTARFRSETKELEPEHPKKARENSTDLDPTWWEAWRAEQAELAGQREPEAFVPQTAEEQALLLDLSRIEPEVAPPSQRDHTAPTAERVVPATIHSDPTRAIRVADGAAEESVADVYPLRNEPPIPRRSAKTTARGLGSPIAPQQPVVVVGTASPEDSSENVFVESPADALREPAYGPTASRAPSPAGSVTSPVAKVAPHGTRARRESMQAPRRRRPAVGVWPIAASVFALAGIVGALLAWSRSSSRTAEIPLAASSSITTPALPLPSTSTEPLTPVAPAHTSERSGKASSNIPTVDPSTKPSTTPPGSKKPAKAMSKTSPAPSASSFENDGLNTVIR